MRQAVNKVKIVGLLSEVDLEDTSYTDKVTGNPVEAIRGKIKVRVDLPVGSEIIKNEIPVQVFSKKYKNDGNPNTAYEDWKKIKEECISIAAGGETKADAIVITSANLEENTYYNQNGVKVSYPRIRASFIRKIERARMTPEASWELEFVVGNKSYVLDDDGVETDKFCINTIVPQYGGSVSVIPVFTTNPAAIRDIEQWEDGSTMKAFGRLNFTVSEAPAPVVVDDTWGDLPVETSGGTRSVSELIIQRATNEPLTGEFAFDAGEINSALAAREKAIEEIKNRKPAVASKKAPAKGKSTALDFGF